MLWSVAATNSSDVKSGVSNFGNSIDVSAPGESIWTTSGSGSYSFSSGTSVAAPIVSGVAGVVSAHFPAHTNEQVVALIKATTDDINSSNPTYVDKLGTGRVNLFKALTAVSPKYMELDSVGFTDDNYGVYAVGDTVYLSALFQNLLSNVTGISINITTASPYINIADASATLPDLNTLDTASNYNDPFVLEVVGSPSYNQLVELEINIVASGYIKKEHVSIRVNKDYINLEENQVATTITSMGKLGYNDVSNSEGLGFTYKGEQLLAESGLMIGDSPLRVADVVRGVSGQDQDFTSTLIVREVVPFVSSKDVLGNFDDSPMTTPLDISIKHKAYVFANSPDDKYVIIVYDIENKGLVDIDNLYAGIFADWDIDNLFLNKAGVESVDSMGYVYSLSLDTIYAAIKLLSGGTFVNYSIDTDGSGGIDPVTGGYSTAEKYTTLSTSRSSSGGAGGSDVAHVVSADIGTLISGQHAIVAFAIIAGDSLSDIKASAASAQLKYDNNPLFAHNYVDNSLDLRLFPNPTNGIVRVECSEDVNYIKVMNVVGDVLIESNVTSINLKEFRSGVYFVEISYLFR